MVTTAGTAHLHAMTPCNRKQLRHRPVIWILTHGCKQFGSSVYFPNDTTNNIEHWQRKFSGSAYNSPYIIVCVWFNDESTLRTAGAKTAVHGTFKRMLAQGQVPDSTAELLDTWLSLALIL